MAAVSRRILLIIFGILVIILGIVLSLPLVPGPGVLLIILGGALVAGRTDWIREQGEKFKSKIQRGGAESGR